MRRFFTGALVLLLHACAAHNHHRIPIDLNAQLAPLIDEAWTGMEQNWNAPVPVGGVPVDVHVEPVAIQWLPCSEEVPPGGSTLTEDELCGYILEALKLQVPDPACADELVRVELLADLHHPDALTIGVRCTLVEEAAPDRTLAGGRSGCLRFERLYCHGCRDRWSGLGSDLPAPQGPPGTESDDGDSAFAIFFPVCSSGSSGYTKH